MTPSFQLLYGLLVIGTTIWVGIDSSKLDMERGRLGGGMLDMSVASWVIGCVFFWIICFPCYFIARGRYQRLNWRGMSQSGMSQPGMAQPMIYGLPPQQTYYGVQAQTAYPSAPPQLSPDGLWWWNGQQWVATTPPMVPGRPGGV